MRIKTIVENLDKAGYFDQRVNEALNLGWQLTARGTLPATPGRKNSHRVLYAELIKPDAEGLPIELTTPDRDFADAVRKVCEGCARVPQSECDAGRCPVYNWCKRLPNCADPSDWEVPEK